MPKIPAVPFYFLRHGETDWNKNRIYMGSTDISLNQNGCDQGEKISQIMGGKSIAHIVSSPLIRAYKTAHIIHKKWGIPITICHDLRELCLGTAQGTPHDSDNALMKKWMNGVYPDGGESRIEFEIRILRGVKNALQLGPNTLIVSHGLVYNTLSSIMRWPLIGLKNCEMIYHAPGLNQAHHWEIESFFKY